MPEILPFHGWRYDVAQVGSLGDVTAPPYDVIDPAAQDRLYQQHPCNIVRLILNRDEPGGEPADAKYQRAAAFLAGWRDEGVLVRDRAPSLYVYHQAFSWEGVEYVRRGFVGRIRLEDFGQGNVFPHEQTMPGPKADRLALWEHGRTCLSPVFGLHAADAEAVQGPLEEACAAVEEPREVVDADGVCHRLWVVDDADAIAATCRELADVPVFIADGHHRYETALAYRDAHAGVEAARFTMMMLVAMNDPGLAILPTHRLVEGLPGLEAATVAEVLGEHFEVTDLGTGGDASREAWRQIEDAGGQDTLAFGTAADGRWQLARLRDPAAMEPLAGEHSEQWRGLGVSRLQTLVLGHLFGRRFPEADVNCRYVHRLEEVEAAVAGGDVPLGVLVAPATIEHVRQIASRLETMPPKSTFFYPKLLSGLALYSLDDDH